jgi:superfamily I DNA/RNA helicase
LNPPQRQAVTQTEGPVLILAGAGSGKTRVITHRIAHILAKRLAEPNEILAVTFTNKAAGEMRERVAALVGPKRAKGIIISTFHSFCLRVLRTEIEHLGYRKNFTVSSEGDVRTIVRRLLGDMADLKESFDAATFLEQIGSIKNEGLTEVPKKRKLTGNDTKDKYGKFLPDVFDQYQSALRAANTVDFDDLLLLTVRLWREHPRILARFQKQLRYVMVDEYQDTNHVQYSLLKALVSEHRNFCVVGDDDQSIYGWRGADIKNILNFEKDYPEATLITLDQNYRSTTSILDAANTVIANNTKRREKRLWSDLGKGRPIDWYITGDEEQEAKTIVSWLQHIRSKTGAKFTDFAILYRSNLQSRPIEIEFRQASIPYVVIGGQDFFERTEVKDIIAYLRVISNPRDEVAFLRIANMPRRGIGDASLHLVHEICRREKIPFGKAMGEALKRGLITGRAEDGIRQILGLLKDFRHRFREAGGQLAELAQELVHRIGYRAELVRTCKSEVQLDQRWSNVEAVLDAIEKYQGQTETLPTLSEFLDQSALNSDDERASKEERRRSGVTLMTIHSSKGLEFPFVFIAGVEDGIMPHDKSVKEGGLEEERRLFYVALTRGKRHVTLFEALSRTKGGKERMTKTSRFIAEIPSELLNRKVRAAQDMVQERVAPPKPKPKKRRPRKKPLSG